MLFRTLAVKKRTIYACTHGVRLFPRLRHPAVSPAANTRLGRPLLSTSNIILVRVRKRRPQKGKLRCTTRYIRLFFVHALNSNLCFRSYPSIHKSTGGRNGTNGSSGREAMKMSLDQDLSSPPSTMIHALFPRMATNSMKLSSCAKRQSSSNIHS